MRTGGQWAKRPEGWGQEYVLQRFTADPSLDIIDLAHEIGPRCTPPVGYHAVYKEIIRWAQKDPSGFGVRLRELRPARDRPYAYKVTRDAKNPDWREQWGEAYLREGTKEKASRAIGTTWANLFYLLKPEHPSYDEKFAEVHDRCVQMKIAGYEGVVDWAINEAQAQLDPRTAGNLAVTVLERLDKKKWSRSEERVMDGQVNHLHTHQIAESQMKALAQAMQTSARLFGPREVKALPAPQQRAIEAKGRVLEMVPAKP